MRKRNINRSRLLRGLIERGALFTAVLLAAGCAIPKHSLVLLTEPPPQSLAKAMRPIPADWDDRLLRIGDSEPSTGGELAHSHTLAHRHSVVSGPSLETDKPLGLTNTGASATHVHLIESQSQSKLQTGPATNIPPSRELLTFVLRKPLRRVPPGMIVAYAGNTIPVGWQICDGTAGSPELRGLYVILKRDQRSDHLRGENAPRHDASHSHSWGVAATDRQKNTNWGFYGGPAPAPQPDFAVSSLSHTHTASEPAGWTGQTDPDNVPPRPPSIALTFIRATAQARKMPPGVLIPFTGDTTPDGWIQWTDQGGTKVTGRFPSGSTTDHPPGTVFGTDSHTHTVTMTHKIAIAASSDAGAGVRRGNGPAMAIAAHTHEAASQDAKPVETGPAAQIPLFVAIRFIRKR